MIYNNWNEILQKAIKNGNVELLLAHPERFDRLKTPKTKQWKRQMKYYLRKKYREYMTEKVDNSIFANEI